MTLEEVQKAKQECASAIMDAILKLERSTGISVSVTVDDIDVTYCGTGGTRLLHDITVDVHI